MTCKTEQKKMFWRYIKIVIGLHDIKCGSGFRPLEKHLTKSTTALVTNGKYPELLVGPNGTKRRFLFNNDSSEVTKGDNNVYRHR